MLFSLLKSQNLKMTIILSSLIILVSGVVTTACKPQSSSGNPEAYIENGKIWAFGSVQLSEIDLPGSVKIERVQDDQSIDSRHLGYKIYGEIEARTGGRGKRSISYVDLHPHDSKPLAFHYDLDFALRNNNPNQVYIYAFLRKAGQSYGNRQRVYLGFANFENDQTITKLQFNNGLRISQIGDGVNAGQWALHYPDIKKIVLTPYNGRCPKFVGQMPGQNPSQNPAQFKGCRPIPAEVDLCQSNPTQTGCSPNFPSQSKRSLESTYIPEIEASTNGLVVVGGKEDVYILDSVDKEAKIVFESKNIEVSADSNSEVCRNTFYVIAKTVGGQLNDSCQLKPAPVESVNGKLTCAVSIEFVDAQTYMDKVCNLTAVFKDTVDESHTIQVLKK